MGHAVYGTTNFDGVGYHQKHQKIPTIAFTMAENHDGDRQGPRNRKSFLGMAFSEEMAMISGKRRRLVL